MLDLINFIAVAIVFNLAFFLYASTRMKTPLKLLHTTAFAVIFNVPLSILLASVYTIMLVYALSIGASEEWVWESMEASNANE